MAVLANAARSGELFASVPITPAFALLSTLDAIFLAIRDVST